MAKKHLNVIYSEEHIVLEYAAGTECQAFMQTIKGRFQLDESSFYLTNPESNNLVVLSSSLPDASTVILHSAKHPKPDIEEHDSTEDESTTSEDGETSVSWPKPSEHSSHEDDFKQDVKKYKKDENMQEVIKRRRLSSSSSSEIVSRVPRPPSPPPRYRRVHSDGTPIPPPPIALKAQLSPNKKW